MTLHVAPATDADVDEIADLAARTFPLACPPELGAEVVRAFIREHLTASRFRQHLGTPGHRVLCARTHDGRAIGYSLLIAGAAMDETCAGLLHGARPVGVSKFYLDPDFHGTGGAAGLLDAVIDTASADGADSLWLATNVANDRARRFYAKGGFTERGYRTFEVGGTLNDDVVLERML